MRSFTRAGLTFDVTAAGPVDGPPVVLLHGFPQTSSSWAQLTPLLVQRGYRVLAPDQRGYSPGARPVGRRAYRIDELVADVLALADAAGDGPVHLVGHDWGAAVAWVLAARQPQRVATLSALSVPHPWAFLRAMLTSTQGLASWYIYLFQLAGLPEAAIGPATSGGRTRFVRMLRAFGQTPARARRDADALAAPGAFTAAVNWYRAAPLASPRRVPTRVAVPTLMVWSDGDAAVRRRAVELTRELVTGPYRLEVLSRVGHWIPEQAPESVARLLDAHLAGRPA